MCLKSAICSESLTESGPFSNKVPKGGRAYFVTDGEDHTLREISGQLVATQGVEPKCSRYPGRLGYRNGMGLENAKLNGAPPMTRQQVRMTGYPFTLSDQRAR